MTNEMALEAFHAWASGERCGDYSAFSALLSPNFRLYSHPMSPQRGVYTGSEALEQMQALIKSREQQPNALEFSEIIQTRGAEGDASDAAFFVFMFNSEGKLAGGYPYRGYNAIALLLEDERVVGFREYFGDVDPAWFGA